MKDKFIALRGKYWLIVGALSYVSAVIPSIIRMIEPMSALDFIYLTIDWFAACILYFFMGAMVGHLVDWSLAKKHKEKYKQPLWLWLTLSIWVTSSLLAAIVAKPWIVPTSAEELYLGWGSIIFFPLAYSIFFNGMAFNMLLPNFVQKTIYGKLLLDIIFLSFFGAWIYLTMKNQAKIARRILLLVLFGILFLGMFGCVYSLR